MSAPKSELLKLRSLSTIADRESLGTKTFPPMSLSFTLSLNPLGKLGLG